MQNKSLKQGLFFTFEGGEGSGKTTLQERLSTYLRSLGYTILSTRAPGGTPLGASIRELLLYKEKIQLSKQAELFLFLADRAQHVEEILLPAIKEKKIILCDRFNDSTIAYQGAARSGDTTFIETLCAFTVGNLTPALTFYLDIDPALGLKRAQDAIVKDGKASYDRLEKEKITFHEKVRKAYLALSKKYSERIVVVDARESLESVFNLVLAKILAKIEEGLC